MVHSAQCFAQLWVSYRVAGVPDVLVIIVESIVVHLNFVGIRTETAEVVHLLPLLVYSGTNWNSDVLYSVVIALGILLKDCKLKAPLLEIVAVVFLLGKDSVGIILSACAVTYSAENSLFFGRGGEECLLISAHSSATS